MSGCKEASNVEERPKNIYDLVRRYKRDHQKCLEKTLGACKEEDPFEDAIEQAVRPNGCIHPHQRRVGNDALTAAKKEAIANRAAIEKCTSFDELRREIASITNDVNRFGDLAVYDISLRLGSRMKLSPAKVYLHCGAKEGAKNLKLPKAYNNAKTLEIAALSPALQELCPASIENFLCVYKDELKKLNKSQIWL